MARYLFAFWPLPGHLSPAIAVALELRHHGHEVAFYTGQRHEAMLTPLGFSFFPMCHINDEALLTRYNLLEHDENDGRANSLSAWQQLRETVLGFTINTIPDQVADLEPILSAWQPDIVVSDHGLLAPIVILHDLKGVPVVVFWHTLASLLPGKNIPVYGLGSPPPTTSLRRLRLSAEKAVARVASRPFLRALNRLRKSYGLADLLVPAATYAGSMPLTLIANIPELDYDRDDLPPTAHYVGRCVWERPSSVPRPDWIDSLPDDRPLIYVTEGTVHAQQPRLLQAAAQGLGGTQMLALLTITPERNLVEAGLTNMPQNVWLKTQTPRQSWQGDIMSKMSLVITNGGAGSILAALASGVPLIVVPTAWDKPENARRVEASGAGIMLKPSQATPQRLREEVERVLGDPSFKRNAQRLAYAFARYNGPERAAYLLETLLNSTCTATRSTP